MRKITEIIIHCSATPEGKDFTPLAQIQSDGAGKKSPVDMGEVP